MVGPQCSGGNPCESFTRKDQCLTDSAGANKVCAEEIREHLDSHPDSTLWSVVNKTGAYTPVRDDDVILCDATGGVFNISLPTAAGIRGKIYLIKKIDTSSNKVTVDTFGTETIDDQLTQELKKYDALMVISDDTNWQVI